MNVLVLCERSGRVRRAFLGRGHNAWSCDIEPADDGSLYHFQDDALKVASQFKAMNTLDLVIAFPPCTHLSVSGARHFAAKRADGRQQAALEFVRQLMALDCPRIAIENPISIISSEIRKPDQIIQPWQFGHGETKATCLWLRGLPALVPTDVVDGRAQRVHRMPPGPERARLRGRTYLGIADAMAEQWGAA